MGSDDLRAASGGITERPDAERDRAIRAAMLGLGLGVALAIVSPRVRPQDGGSAA